MHAVTVQGILCGSMRGTYNMLWFYDIFRRGFRQFLEAIVTKTPYFGGFQPVNGYRESFRASSLGPLHLKHPVRLLQKPFFLSSIKNLGRIAFGPTHATTIRSHFGGSPATNASSGPRVNRASALTRGRLSASERLVGTRRPVS